MGTWDTLDLLDSLYIVRGIIVPQIISGLLYTLLLFTLDFKSDVKFR